MDKFLRRSFTEFEGGDDDPDKVQQPMPKKRKTMDKDESDSRQETDSFGVQKEEGDIEASIVSDLRLMSSKYQDWFDPERIVHNNLNLSYIRLFSKETSDKILKYLENVANFENTPQKVHVYGRWRNIPRKQVAYGDPGLTYTYSGVTVPALPWPPLLLEIRKLLSDVTNWDFNFVLINRYKDGSDHIGEHRDDEKDLAEDAPIASLSFGQHREFVLRHWTCKRRTPMKGRKPIEPVTKVLEHGSLLLMNPPTNRYWYHSLPPRRDALHPRFNLTFRRILTEDERRKAVESSSEKLETSFERAMLEESFESGEQFSQLSDHESPTPKAHSKLLSPKYRF